MRPSGRERATTPRVGATATRAASRRRETSGWDGPAPVLLLGVLAAVPVIAATARALADGWAPTFDDAIVATNAFDALSAHARAAGTYSDATVPAVGTIYNLGPLVAWLLAVPARLPGDWALPATAGLTNTACVVGVVALARRRGGPVFMVATAVAVCLMCRSLPTEALHAVLNVSIALLPFTLLLFLSWSIACGEHRLLPLTVLVGSFVLQAHASVAVPAAGVVAVGITGLAAFAWRHRAEPAVRAPLRRSVLAGLAVVVLCWVVPVAAEVVDHPGNLTLVARTALRHERTIGPEAGWHALVGAIGLWPWWTAGAPTDPGRLFEVFGAPDALKVGSTVAILGALLGAGAVGARRGRADAVAGTTIALVLAVALVVGVGHTPRRLTVFSLKATLWGSPAGMFVWLVLGWALVALLPAVRRRGAVLAAGGARPALAAVAVGSVAVAAVVAVASQAHDANRSLYHPVHVVAGRFERSIPEGRVVRVEAVDRDIVRAYALQTALIYELRRRGYHPLTRDAHFQAQFGAWYAEPGHAPEDVLRVADRAVPVRDGGHVLARIPARRGAPASGARLTAPLVATVRPAGPADFCPPSGPAAPLAAGAVARPSVVPGAVLGSVERSKVLGPRAVLCGWAASPADRAVADVVAVYVDGRAVAAVRPSLPRPDVVRAYPGVGSRAGFSLEVPAALLGPGRGARVQVLGIERGRAAPLPFQCATAPHDLGC